MKYKKNKRRNTVEKCGFYFIMICSFVLINIALFQICLWIYDNILTEYETDQIQDETKITEIESIADDYEKTTDEESIDTFDPYWDFINTNYLDVDFRELVKINPEVVAWLSVNGTNIHYPVVQHKDNTYYLNHSIYGNNNEAGWVFMDYRNDLKAMDRNTIIYGHGRLDGSMFGSLRDILKHDWYENEDHFVIRMSTPDMNSVWQIFSVYKIPTTSDYIQTEFENDNEYLGFLKLLMERSMYDFHTSVSENDRILTLSTCFDEAEKIVVHAKLIKNK